MSYDRPDILRAEARELLRMLNQTVQELCATVDLPERIALTKWANEGKRLIDGRTGLVRCLRCGHEWESKLAGGAVPQQCGVCRGKSASDNGESMIVAAPANVIPMRKFACVRKPPRDFFGLVAPDRSDP